MAALLNAQQGGELGATAKHTGLPDALKERFEKRFGMQLHDVRVHRNSDKPAELGAKAYTRGNEIHLGPGRRSI